MRDNSDSTRMFNFQTHRYGSQSPPPASSPASGPRTTRGFVATVGLTVAVVVAAFSPVVAAAVVGLVVAVAVATSVVGFRTDRRTGQNHRPPDRGHSQVSYEPAD